MAVTSPTRPARRRRQTTAVVAAPGNPPAILVLEPGDHLTRYEFERCYEAMPEQQKAELIDGVVYMSSPVRYATHGQPHAQIMTWLGVYSAATPGCGLGDNASVRLDLANEPQPDGLLRLERDAGGASFISSDGYVEGPPELIAEIAASSASYDLHDKLRIYQRHRVQEYVIWRIYDRQIDWFCLHEGRYGPLPADEAGIVHSRIFPGLWLHGPAMLAGDLAQVLTTLQTGLTSAEHAAFVATLQARIG